MEFILANYAPLMFAGLIVFLLMGFPVAFSLGACGLFFGFVGVELGLLPEALLQALPLGGERLFLAFLRGEQAELVHGVAQPVFLAPGGIQLGAGLMQQSERRAPGVPGAVGGVRERQRAAECVQQSGMGGGIGQAHLFVLALHLDQQRAQAAQQGHPGRLIIDEGAGAAIGADHAAEHEFVLGVDALFGQQIEGGMVSGDGKARDHHRLFGAGADQAGIGAHAQCEAQAVEQDGFAGTGLAGKHGQPWAEAQVQPFDEHDIADGKGGEHRLSDPVRLRKYCRSSGPCG